MVDTEQPLLRLEKRPAVASFLLVGGQFLLLGYLALSGPVWPWASSAMILGAAAMILGLWAVGSMRWRQFHVFPEPGQDVSLVTAGPYRWIRHPMYTAVLLFGLALALNAPRLERWAVWVALALVLILKLTREERLLLARFPAYAGYRQRSWRLVPWVY